MLEVYKAIPVVAGIITVDKYVLLTKKYSNHPDTNNRWEFPGGKVEDGEMLCNALARELREELGIEVVVDPVPVYARMNYYSFGGAMIVYFKCVPKVYTSLAGLKDKLRQQKVEWILILPSHIEALITLPGTKEAVVYVDA